MTEGILLLNKPADITSFDCIRALKKILPRKTKIGHSGTLDPFATGLMIIAIGRNATKQLSAFTNQAKTYVATAQLGLLTDTLDGTGEVVDPGETTTPTEQALRDALASLQPAYEQIPPSYAALKHKGKPLYELMRKKKITEEQASKIVATKQRTVSISQASFDSYAPPTFSITITVSKGTYIRSLMNDIARRAGSCATTTLLARTSIGPLCVSTALPVDQLTEQSIHDNLMPIDQVLARITQEPA